MFVFAQNIFLFSRILNGRGFYNDKKSMNSWWKNIKGEILLFMFSCHCSVPCRLKSLPLNRLMPQRRYSPTETPEHILGNRCLCFKHNDSVAASTTAGATLRKCWIQPLKQKRKSGSPGEAVIHLTNWTESPFLSSGCNGRLRRGCCQCPWVLRRRLAAAQGCSCHVWHCGDAPGKLQQV